MPGSSRARPARAWMSRLRKAWICSFEEGLKGEPSWLLKARRLTLHLPGRAGQSRAGQAAARRGGQLPGHYPSKHNLG